MFSLEFSVNQLASKLTNGIQSPFQIMKRTRLVLEENLTNMEQQFNVWTSDLGLLEANAPLDEKRLSRT